MKTSTTVAAEVAEVARDAVVVSQAVRRQNNLDRRAPEVVEANRIVVDHVSQLARVCQLERDDIHIRQSGVVEDQSDEFTAPPYDISDFPMTLQNEKGWKG